MYYEPEVSSYVDFEPTPVAWTEYYETPEETLYYYDVPTNDYYVESEPSPYTQYYIYSEPTQTFVYYEPTVPCVGAPISIAGFENEPTYAIEEEIEEEPVAEQEASIEELEELESILESEPSVPHCKVTFDDVEEEEEVSEPSYVNTFTAFYEQPTVDLYYYDEPSNNYFVDAEPTPSFQYYFWSEPTQTFEEYAPTPVVWTDAFATPETDLYFYDESTGTYNIDYEPSPAVSYFYYEPDSQNFYSYEPVSISACPTD